MGDDKISISMLIFMYFWGFYYLLHVILFTKDCVCRNIQLSYPTFYDNYGKIIDIKIEKKSIKKNEINTYELNSHTYEININNDNAKEENNVNFKLYDLNNNEIIY
tara:strand:+ start:1223 stop:1540 length:318 start_codon:yes stop_codon:yes gene_type:complete